MEQINITKLFIHIIDGLSDIPVLTDMECSLDRDIHDYVEEHVLKLFNDENTKEVYYANEHNQIKHSIEEVMEGKKSFLALSKDLAYNLNKYIYSNPNIPSGDLLCVYFTSNEKPYIAIMKFSYKDSYTHYIFEDETDTTITIQKHKNILPQISQRIDEGFIIDIQGEIVYLKEKKFEIDNEKKFYLSEELLQTTANLTDKQKVDIINKATKKVVKKFCNDDIQKVAEAKNIITDSYIEKGIIDIDDISDKIFKENVEVKEAFVGEIEKAGLEEKVVAVKPSAEKRIIKNHRLVTNDGIEIKLSSELLTSKEKIEFLTNPDGSMAILLKNISDIKDK